MRIEILKEWQDLRLLATIGLAAQTIYTVQQRNTSWDDVVSTIDEQAAYAEYKQRFMDACDGTLSYGDLNDDMKDELRQAYLCDHQECVSWSELANCRELVSENELEAEYGGISFVPEDFSCCL